MHTQLWAMSITVGSSMLYASRLCRTVHFSQRDADHGLQLKRNWGAVLEFDFVKFRHTSGLVKLVLSLQAPKPLQQSSLIPRVPVPLQSIPVPPHTLYGS